MMAASGRLRLLMSTLLILLLCLSQVSLSEVDVRDCGALCSVRCGQHSRPNRCNRACGTCCARCKCVPPGTYGKRELCGSCYTDMTTRGNKPKCP